MSQKTLRKARKHTDEESIEDVNKVEPVSRENKDDSKDEEHVNDSSEKSADKQPEVNGNDDKVSANTRSHSTSQTKSSPEKSLTADEAGPKDAPETESTDEMLKPPDEFLSVEVDETDVEVEDVKDKVASTAESKAESTAEGVKEDVGNEKSQATDVSEDKSDLENENVEIEPLILESENPDPELEFDESSDLDSRKGSPIIRSRTRRSLTRNIPTPKTPKSIIDANEEDAECSDRNSVTTASTLEIVDLEPDKHTSDVIRETSHGVHKYCESFESVGNISTRAVVGSDVTRNLDISYNTEYSPFLNASKDRSVGETLRCLSSRRAIRPTRDYQKLLQQINQERDNGNLLPPPKRISVEHVSGRKRKNHSKTPENPKRFKTESPGLLSYISSPIMSIRSHFTRTDVTSSTPKLTGYRNKTLFDNSGSGQICLDVSRDDNAEKKWCTIM